LHSQWNKNKGLDKYLIAAIAAKIVYSCEKEPLLGVNNTTLNEIQEQYVPLISEGKFINKFAEQNQSHHIDYLSTKKNPC